MDNTIDSILRFCIYFLQIKRFYCIFWRTHSASSFFYPINLIVAHTLIGNKPPLPATFAYWRWEIDKQLLDFLAVFELEPLVAYKKTFNKVETLCPRRWNKAFLLKLFQCCFVNIELTSINKCRLNFHSQSNINVETTMMNFDDRSCFNVGSRLICLLGILFVFHQTVSLQLLELKVLDAIESLLLGCNKTDFIYFLFFSLMSTTSFLRDFVPRNFV